MRQAFSRIFCGRKLIPCCIYHKWSLTSRRLPRTALAAAGAFVSVNDARDQRVAHDIAAGEVAVRNALGVAQNALRVDQTAGLATGQIDLADIARDDGAAGKAYAGQEHLHLLGRGVLRLV